MNKSQIDRLAILDSINLEDTVEEDCDIGDWERAYGDGDWSSLTEDEALNPGDRIEFIDGKIMIDTNANSWNAKAAIEQDPRFNPSAFWPDLADDDCVPF